MMSSFFVLNKIVLYSTLMMIEENASLLQYNTLGIDVKTRFLVEYNTVEELIQFLRSNTVEQTPILPVGQGSNLLFLDDYKGIVLHSKITSISVIDQNDTDIIIKVGAGVVWDDFTAYCVQNNWGGIENLSFIPGQVGAAAVQNIGAYGVEVKDSINRVETVNRNTNTVEVFPVSECRYDYRNSIFKQKLKHSHIVTAVFFRLTKNPTVFQLDYQHLKSEVEKQGEINLFNIRKTIIAIRSNKLPDIKELGNAGSFFMNPIVDRALFNQLHANYPEIPHYFVSKELEKLPAAWLIEQCGWKGKRIGNVGVHKNQALVLVNFGGATGKEVAQLASDIQQSVLDKFGVKLIPEVNYIQ